MRYIQYIITKKLLQKEFMAEYESIKSKFQILDTFNKFCKFVAQPEIMADKRLRSFWFSDIRYIF